MPTLRINLITLFCIFFSMAPHLLFAQEQCSQPQDCILVAGDCGAPTAVNKKEAKSFLAEVSRKAPALDCAEQGAWEKELCHKPLAAALECRNSQCAIALSEPEIEKILRTCGHESEAQACVSKGWYWADDTKDRGRLWGCIQKAKDGGKACKDGSECEAGFCINNKAKSEGACSELYRAPNGCNMLLVKGAPDNICRD